MPIVQTISHVFISFFQYADNLVINPVPLNFTLIFHLILFFNFAIRFFI